jgi:hypothetical protein
MHNPLKHRLEAEKISCFHCYPATSDHIEFKIASILNSYLYNPIVYLLNLFLLKNILFLCAYYIKRLVLEISQMFNHVHITAQLNRAQLNNGTLVLWDEAKKRDLKIFNVKFKDHNTQNFLLIFNGNKYHFDTNPVYIKKIARRYNNASKFDDKLILIFFQIK